MTTPNSYPDEQYLADQMKRPMELKTIDWDAIWDGKPEVIPHNTMRFDVHMSHIGVIFDTSDVTKEKLAKAISDAIIKAVEDTIGAGLDGIPIPGGIDRIMHKHSIMLHRETLTCDLS